MTFLSNMPIKKHIIVVMLIMVLLPLLICGCVAMKLNYNTAVRTTETNMEEMAVLCANHIRWEIQTYKNIAKDAGCNQLLSDPAVRNELKEETLNFLFSSRL